MKLHVLKPFTPHEEETVRYAVQVYIECESAAAKAEGYPNPFTVEIYEVALSLSSAIIPSLSARGTEFLAEAIDYFGRVGVLGYDEVIFSGWEDLRNRVLKQHAMFLMEDERFPYRGAEDEPVVDAYVRHWITGSTYVLS